MSISKSSPVFYVLFALVFAVSGLTTNLLQVLFFIILWPINRELFRKINYLFSYIIYSEMVFVSDWWSGMEYNFYVDKEDRKYLAKEHSFWLLNHKYEIDWLTAWCIHDRIHILGNCKAFVKDSLKYVPVIGWCWWFAEFLFLHRDWAKDKYTIETQIEKLFDYENPVTMLLYAEGTRFTKEKHEASVKFAQSKGLPELKEHLLPRTKGFTVGLPHFRHNLPAIYNVQVAINGKEKPTLKAIFNGRRFEAHVYIERIPIEQVPENEKECEKWMLNVFEKKDKMMVSFVNTGDWFKESGVKPVEKYVPPRNYFSVINMVFWTLITLVPFFYLAFNILISGNLIHMALFTLPVFLLYAALSKMVSVTEVSKSSSSYGSNKPKVE